MQGGNPLTVAVGIVIDIIRKNNPDYDPEPPEGRDASPSNHDPIYLGTLLYMFANHVPEFLELILSPNRTVNEDGVFEVTKRDRLKTAWGSSVEPLGFDRFKTCELMAELLHCSNMGLHNEVGSHEYMLLRDAERERLRSQRAFHRQDEDSGFVYAENTNEYGNGMSLSALDSGSPDDLRRMDSSNAGDDDGFEDVGSASILLEAKSELDNNKGENNKSVMGTFTHVPKLDAHEDLVDEPLTPPRNERPQNLRPEERQEKPQEGPLSPTSSGLTDRVQGFNIDSNDQESVVLKQTEETRKGAAATTLNPSDNEQAGGVVQDDLSLPASAPSADVVGDQTSVAIGSPRTESDFKNKILSVQELLTPSELENFSEYIQKDSEGRPVVGDYLKIMFYKHNVLPTILVS